MSRPLGAPGEFICMMDAHWVTLSRLLKKKLMLRSHFGSRFRLNPGGVHTVAERVAVNLGFGPQLS